LAGKRLALIAILSLVPTAALAQELPEEDPEQKASVRLTLGAGIAYVPRYPGADQYRLRGIPVFGMGYGRFFAGGDEGAGGAGGAVGMNLLRDSAWRLGSATRDANRTIRASRAWATSSAPRAWWYSVATHGAR
jgi:outer membrane scaffolding protein for murein synthesis (MipA/OmpV family)